MKETIKVPFFDGLIETNAPAKRTEDMEHIRDWLSYQPHLPALTDEHLHLFLHSCYDNLERTKKTIESYFTMTTMTPELWANRDPLGNDVQQALDICDFVCLPGTTPEGYSLCFYRLSDTSANKFVHIPVLKTFMMVNDMILSEERKPVDGYVSIFDMKGFSLGHLARLSVSIIGKFMFYVQECHPVRLKSVHVINTVPFMDKVLALLKPFMKSELADMLHFHGPVESLPDTIPLDMLPQEYNGKAPPLSQLSADVRRKLEGRYVDWFVEHEKLKVDETKRVGKSTVADNLFGVEGSFRKLDID